MMSVSLEGATKKRGFSRTAGAHFASCLQSLFQMPCVAALTVMDIRSVFSARRGFPSSRLLNHAVGSVLLLSSSYIKGVMAQSTLPTCVDGYYEAGSPGSLLPCTFGGCTFSKDADGTLSKTGTCSGTTGSLHLSGKGIKALPAGIFDDVGTL